jgi:2'-5' RNA ligase
MRLFIALDIDETVRQRLAKFMDGVRGFAPDVRFVGAESFHVTLKFLGETEKLEAILQAVAPVTAPQFPIEFRGYGFFPGAKNPRVFWVGIHAGPELGALARKIDEAVSSLGFEREKGPYHPHLTLARSGSGRPQRMKGDRVNSLFAHLQQKLSQLPEPEFGTMTAREFHLYESKLLPRGAVYTKLRSFPLGRTD